MSILLAMGIGVGLSAVSGVRAFLPLALVGLAARIGLFALPAPFGFLDDWAVIGSLVVLAIAEAALDKVGKIEPVLDLAEIPIRAVAGAVLFSAALSAGLGADAVPELVAGGVISGAIAALKAVLRPSAGASSAGVSAFFLSAFEDAVALIGGILAVLVPLLPLLLVAFLLFFFYRIRRRRGRRFKGLRILGD